MWVYLVGAIVFEVTGTMSLRASEGFRRTVWIAPVIASYVIAFRDHAIRRGSGG